MESPLSLMFFRDSCRFRVGASIKLSLFCFFMSLRDTIAGGKVQRSLEIVLSCLFCDGHSRAPERDVLSPNGQTLCENFHIL
jgi:hypothetical protein